MGKRIIIVLISLTIFGGGLFLCLKAIGYDDKSVVSIGFMDLVEKIAALEIKSGKLDFKVDKVEEKLDRVLLNQEEIKEELRKIKVRVTR
ncbi:MAG: hypothetical protein KKC11_07805 [Candidatus Omnitrophica bacterium]|nr:hypothetical protein [Candidatus Omnitrophota bacterium]MBU1133712.1 hypothetical protein [Candidatus Omnitrophota bacterium]MBU1367734.1 hypothetical protein [Candidatus Omnitrophota bacterium]MBU1524339.1 hypothetical protein [Candidatus Omnitrophota bacterium]MBU1810019.1 hypothetical protein [Candidatus Omnitrophota bacterium]